MCGMPSSVRWIVAEKPAALAGDGIAAASSAITTLATKNGAIDRACQRVRSSATAQVLIDSPSQSNGSRNGRTRGTIAGDRGSVQAGATACRVSGRTDSGLVFVVAPQPQRVRGALIATLRRPVEQ